MTIKTVAVPPETNNSGHGVSPVINDLGEQRPLLALQFGVQRLIRTDVLSQTDPGTKLIHFAAEAIASSFFHQPNRHTHTHTRALHARLCSGDCDDAGSRNARFRPLRAHGAQDRPPPRRVCPANLRARA